MKRHNALYERMRYKPWKWGCDRSVIKGTALGEKTAFSFSYRRPLEGIFMELYTAHSERMRYERSRCGCDRSVIKGTVLGEKLPFPLNIGFHWTDFYETSHRALWTRALQTL